MKPLLGMFSHGRGERAQKSLYRHADVYAGADASLAAVVLRRERREPLTKRRPDLAAHNHPRRTERPAGGSASPNRSPSMTCSSNSHNSFNGNGTNPNFNNSTPNTPNVPWGSYSPVNYGGPSFFGNTPTPSPFFPTFNGFNFGGNFNPFVNSNPFLGFNPGFGPFNGFGGTGFNGFGTPTNPPSIPFNTFSPINSFTPFSYTNPFSTPFNPFFTPSNFGSIPSSTHSTPSTASATPASTRRSTRRSTRSIRPSTPRTPNFFGTPNFGTPFTGFTPGFNGFPSNFNFPFSGNVTPNFNTTNPFTGPTFGGTPRELRPPGCVISRRADSFNETTRHCERSAKAERSLCFLV